MRPPTAPAAPSPPAPQLPSAAPGSTRPTSWTTPPTSYTAQATDAAGNTVTLLARRSPTSRSSAPPAAPTGLGTTPASPANDNDPRITGTAQAGTTVNLYADRPTARGGIVASGTGGGVRRRGTQPARCRRQHDHLVHAPARPTRRAISRSARRRLPTSRTRPRPARLPRSRTTPASPANDNDPRITGTAEAGSTVNLYATADGTGGSIASGTAAAFGGAGSTHPTSPTTPPPPTPQGQPTPPATSPPARRRPRYVEDSAAPSAPSSLATLPASPANDNDPRITGTAEAGSTVNLYATADCTGGSIASGTAAAFGGAGLNPPDIADNTTTSYTARATDAPGNQSACSASVSYVEDSAAPSAPSSLGTLPASPANDNDPRITGTAEAGSTVNLYATADCTGGSIASGTAAAFGGAGLNPPDIADNTTTSYTAKATDAAGNQSACSSAVSYLEDSTSPSSVVTFPSSGTSYGSATWSNVAGSASDSGGSGLLRIEVSVKRSSDNQYWNGTAFADGTENWRTATGTASWSLTFPSSNFPADGDYVVRVRATDTALNPETPASYSLTYDTAAPNTTITAQPERPDKRDRRLLLVHLDGGWLHVRVPARQRRLVLVHLAQELQRSHPGRPHLRRAGNGRRSQHGCLPGELHLDDRHGRAEHHDHGSAERPEQLGERRLLLQLE